MRIILHIGLHKTGTSALQVFLRDNAEALARHGILYRNPTHSQGSHNPLIMGFTREGQPRLDVLSLIGNLVRDAKERDQTLLISSEMLCEDRVDIEPFLAMLRPHAISAIAYVRAPDEFLSSAFNHQVRSWRRRRTAPVRSGVDSLYDNLTYARALSRWQRPDVVLVLAPYHRPQWRGGNLCQDFLAMLGIDDISGFSFSRNRINDSWPESLIETLRVVNKLPIEEPAHTQLIAGLKALWQANPEAFPGLDLLGTDERNVLRQNLVKVLPRLRPYYRSGFDDRFLTEERA